jgi:hypothetical protein
MLVVGRTATVEVLPRARPVAAGARA